METVRKTLEFPSDTLKALEQLAKITGAEAGVPEVIQDALRVYEWAVFNQAKGNIVVAGPPPPPASFGQPAPVWNFSGSSKNAEPGLQVLGKLFDDKEAEEAKRFFKAA
jgi:hypothetical protein